MHHRSVHSLSIAAPRQMIRTVINHPWREVLNLRTVLKFRMRERDGHKKSRVCGSAYRYFPLQQNGLASNDRQVFKVKHVPFGLPISPRGSLLVPMYPNVAPDRQIAILKTAAALREARRIWLCHE